LPSKKFCIIMRTDRFRVDWRILLKLVIQRVENPFDNLYISTIKKDDVCQTYLPQNGWLCMILSDLFTSWAKLASPTCYLHNEFSGYFFRFKRERNFASSLSIRIVESSLSNVWQRKDLAKLFKKNDKVKLLFLENFKSKKIEP
jgi:hypothetical protein